MLYPVTNDQTFLNGQTRHVCTDDIFIRLKQIRKINNVKIILMNRDLISTELIYGVLHYTVFYLHGFKFLWFLYISLIMTE